MGRIGKRSARAAVLLTVFGALGLLLMPASASSPSVVARGDLVPEEILERFADCPDQSAFSEGFNFLLCLNVRAYDGELRLGKIDAQIGELEVSVGVGLGPGLEVEFVMGEGGGEGGGSGPDPVRISGGILGIPELDPLIDAEPLGLLSLSATPQIGEIDAEDESFAHLSRITLPLSIKLNNTLFGDNCQIGTPEEPIVINLVTGTTEPPPGVEPMTGAPPVESPEHQWKNYTSEGGVDPITGYGTGLGAISVDNTFEVPAARKCDFLPRELHDGLDEPVKNVDALLEELTGADNPLDTMIGTRGGLFNPVINELAGLPSPAGANYMRFNVDISWGFAGLIEIAGGDWEPNWAATPGFLDFGDVEVGESSTETLVLENPTPTPFTFAADPAAIISSDAGQFEHVSGDCAGQTLAPAEHCSVTVRFTPESIGTKHSLVGLEIANSPPGWQWLPQFGFVIGHPYVALRGAGAALSAKSLDFGSVEVGQSSELRTATFENTSSRSYTVDGGVALSGSSGSLPSWEIVADGCGGETLQTGDTCEVDLRFTPTSPGIKDVTLEIRGAGSVALGSAALSGSGKAPLTGTAPAFGDVDVGGSQAQTATFEHAGTHQVTVDELALSGTAANVAQWQLSSDDCGGQTLSPGDSCSVDVQLSPTSAGAKNVALQARSGSLVLGTAALQGSGVNPLTPVDTPLAFGAVAVGSSSPSRTAVFEHTGTQPAAIEDVALQGTASRFASWQLDGSDCEGRTLNPGDSCEVEVVLAPNTAGTKNVNLDVRGPGAIVLGRAALTGSGVNP